MNVKMKQTLMERLDALHAATPETAALMHGLFTQVFITKGSVLHWQEQSSPLLYFVERGCVRGYFYYEKEQYTSWAIEHGFLLPLNPVAKTAEIEYAEFVTDATVWVLNIAKLELLKQPDLHRMLLEIQQDCMLEGKRRELALRLQTADMQFLFMKRDQQELMDKLPHDILASLLNVKPKHLYKLKKKHSGR